MEDCPYFGFGGEHFLKQPECFDVEFDEFSQEVKTALQDLFGSHVMINYVACDVL